MCVQLMGGTPRFALLPSAHSRPWLSLGALVRVMTFLTACVTNHVGQIAALLLSRSISIACVHNGATFPAVSLNMTRFATAVTSSLITTGCYSIAGFTRSIVTAASGTRSLCSVQRQLCGIPFNLFCNVTGTSDCPLVRMCIPGRQLLLNFCP